MADAPLVLVDHPAGDSIVTVTLNNPSKRNALSLSMMHALIDALHHASEIDGARGIVLAANGPVFSAGHDFADMAGADLPFLRKLLTTCTELMTLVQQLNYYYYHDYQLSYYYDLIVIVLIAI